MSIGERFRSDRLPSYVHYADIAVWMEFVSEGAQSPTVEFKLMRSGRSRWHRWQAGPWRSQWFSGMADAVAALNGLTVFMGGGLDRHERRLTFAKPGEVGA